VVVGARVVEAAVVASGTVVALAFALDVGAAVAVFPEVDTDAPDEPGGVADAVGAALAAHDAVSIEKPTNSTEARRGRDV
jgi:hypothetical protein